MKTVILELPGEEIEIFVESIPRIGETIRLKDIDYPVDKVIHEITKTNNVFIMIYLGPPKR
jgi:hypothetical protein